MVLAVLGKVCGRSAGLAAFGPGEGLPVGHATGPERGVSQQWPETPAGRNPHPTGRTGASGLPGLMPPPPSFPEPEKGLTGVFKMGTEPRALPAVSCMENVHWEVSPGLQVSRSQQEGGVPPARSLWTRFSSREDFWGPVQLWDIMIPH